MYMESLYRSVIMFKILAKITFLERCGRNKKIFESESLLPASVEKQFIKPCLNFAQLTKFTTFAFLFILNLNKYYELFC